MYRSPTSSRYLERFTRLFAGILSLIGIAGWYRISPRFLLLNLLVGINLTLFALSGYCIMADILHRCGVASLRQH